MSSIFRFGFLKIIGDGRKKTKPTPTDSTYPKSEDDNYASSEFVFLYDV